MYSRWQLAQKYIRYYLTASNGKGHGIHSPFVYDFIRHVLIGNRHFYAYKQVEALREQLLNDNTILQVEDFGAGSVTGQTKQRSVSSIAKHAAKSKKLAQLIFRIVQYYAPLNIIELGTSLGITTAYMSMACRDARIITGEGSGEIAKRAQQNFADLQLNMIQVITGNFDSTIDNMLGQLPTVDLAFFDGNHRLEPTKQYFEKILAKTHTDSIIILDDIHWSAEMEQAWAAIQQHPKVTCTIDLFFIGLVFFKEEIKEKQHFTIRY